MITFLQIMTWKRCIVVFIFVSTFHVALSQDSLLTKIESLAEYAHGHVGVAVKFIGSSDTLSLNGKHPFPMQSVYKFPLAMAILKQVDLGKLSLTQKIHITKSDYFQTHSPLRDKYPAGEVDITLAEILAFTISQSDNVGCDLLFKLIGGPKKVDMYLHSIGINDIAVLNTEREMHQDGKLQYKNWSTPMAIANLFEIFATKNPLSESSTQWLMQALTNTTVGLNRIKGQLPTSTIVAHRTGTGDTKDGITTAVNNAGIVTLPSGARFIIVVFITGSAIKPAEETIASIAKLAFDYFVAAGK